MILYHGSNVPIESIDLNKSKIGKDFGCGFYLSDNYDQAFKMACLTVDRTEEGLPIVTSFEFDLDAFIGLDYSIKEYKEYSEEWAEFVLENRRNRSRQNCHSYDLVIGPIANDKVGVQIRRYLLGDISVKQLVRELKYREGITFQYFFGTQRGIDLLKRL